MLTNDELKKKIAKIIDTTKKPCNCLTVSECLAQTGCKYHNRNDGITCFSYARAEALIAAGIGDVKDLQVQVDSLEITNIALQAGYDDAEKDRLYWVDKYKEAEHRAEVLERVLKDIAYQQENLTIKVNGRIWSKEEIYKQWIAQAEKEFAEVEE